MHVKYIKYTLNTLEIDLIWYFYRYVANANAFIQMIIVVQCVRGIEKGPTPGPFTPINNRQ